MIGRNIPCFIYTHMLTHMLTHMHTQTSTEHFGVRATLPPAGKMQVCFHIRLNEVKHKTLWNLLSSNLTVWRSLEVTRAPFSFLHLNKMKSEAGLHHHRQ